ncbi:UNVERIFIED_CONTAM: hypothetical protein Sradi_3853100 [Sesamum radiatum]|uniref:MULE transposase domain-containing protein n=1 Tax=Sesamum radiatum TaxID=300843 RepID=A0AAW2Q1V6_SESRA
MVFKRSERNVSLPPPRYHPESETLTLSLFYGGEARHLPEATYVGGKVAKIDYVQMIECCVETLNMICDREGVPKGRIFYTILNKGYKLLIDNYDLSAQFKRIVDEKQEREMRIYIDTEENTNAEEDQISEKEDLVDSDYDWDMVKMRLKLRCIMRFKMNRLKLGLGIVLKGIMNQVRKRKMMLWKLKLILMNIEIQMIFDVKNIKTAWLKEKYMQKFKSDPKRNIKRFRVDIINELRVNVSKDQAYRAKRAALKELEGSPKFQYTRLWDYADEIRKTNPGSTVIVGTEEEGGEHRFSRLYICYGALEQGFRAGCRPIISVDGCHLKGPHGGILLTAVGVDPSNNLFPIAYAVVVGEWKMRMQELKNVSEAAYEWLNEKPGTQWSISHFTESSICDMLLNNVCETFNSCILEAREKPILTMLEWIREYLMRRLQECRDRAAGKWKGDICPRIKDILQKHIAKVSDCIPIKADDTHYQISGFDGSQHIVDLD